MLAQFRLTALACLFRKSLGAVSHAWLACSLLSASPVLAQFPVQDMDARDLGLAYTFALRGQNITDAEVGAHEVLHQVGLGYAPIPYFAVQAAVGLDRLSTDPHGQTRFRGDYGISPSLGISGYSPFFAGDILRASASLNALFLSSEDDRGFRYSATLINPSLGLIVSPTVFLDLGLGARGHLMDGEMTPPGTTTGASFANSNTGRGYLSMALKTPFEKAFLNLDFEFSPEVDFDWSEGPREAAVSLTFGTVLGWKGKSKAEPRTGKPVYFPAYDEMKDKQKKMAEELE